MHMLSLFVLVFTTGCCGYNFNFTLSVSSSDLGTLAAFPPVFDRTLQRLAINAGLPNKESLNLLTFESLLLLCTNYAWYPYINKYYFDDERLSNNSIQFLRRITIGKLMPVIPKYSLKHFWTAPLKSLIFQTSFYLKLNTGTDDVLKLLKKVYRSTTAEALQQIQTYRSRLVPYLEHAYHNDFYILPLIKKLQVNKTLDMTRLFGITKEKMTFLTHDSFDKINDVFSKYVFYSVHNNQAKAANEHKNALRIVERIQYYHASIYEWSISCAETSPEINYLTQNLDSISNRCFARGIQPVAKALYGIQQDKTTKLLDYNMEEASILANSTLRVVSLQRAKVFLQKMISGIEEIEKSSKQPYTILANSAGFRVADLNQKKVSEILVRYHHLPWRVLEKAYQLDTSASVKLMGLNFLNLVKITNQDRQIMLGELQYKTLPLNAILDAVRGRATQTSLYKQLKQSVRQQSNASITNIQRVYQLQSDNVIKSSLVSLTQTTFGLNSAEFKEFYGVTTAQEPFFRTASVNDFGLLLRLHSNNIVTFSIQQLIDLTKGDYLYADVMLLSPKQLANAKNISISTHYKNSIPQIVGFHHDGVTSEQFTDYIKRWSSLTTAATKLKEEDIEKLAKRLNRRPEEVAVMRILDIINAVIISFGKECGTNKVDFCIALQNCVQTELGKRCQCVPGYRYSDGGTCIDQDECLYADITCDKNAACSNTQGSYKCICKSGYQGDGLTCQNINECTLNTHNCHPNATCHDSIGSYKCRCKPGFKGDDYTCKDENECTLNSHSCHKNSKCINTLGSYKCRCKDGFAEDGVNYCIDVDECDGTAHGCPVESFCVNEKGSFQCKCKSNFIQEGKKCHQCFGDDKQCSKNAECFQQFSGNKCVCKSGYKGNGSFCEDVDECAQSDVCVHGQCKNGIGYYSCLCNRGYHHVPPYDHTKCLDIDECEVNRLKNIESCVGKDQKCVNVPGTYSCLTQKPNTALNVGLGVSIPLLLILAIVTFLLYHYRRKQLANSELAKFDLRLAAMNVNAVNHTYEGEEEKDGNEFFQNKPLQYIFQNGKKPE